MQNPAPTDLRTRLELAQALGWPVEAVRTFSLPAARELLARKIDRARTRRS